MAGKKQEELLEDIVLSPDPRLEEECAPLTEEEIVSPETKKLAERMLDDMYAADGCGLAAPANALQTGPETSCSLFLSLSSKTCQFRLL